MMQTGNITLCLEKNIGFTQIVGADWEDCANIGFVYDEKNKYAGLEFGLLFWAVGLWVLVFGL
jgi:hypothetical protein